MLAVTQEDRHEVAQRLHNGPMGQIDPASPMLCIKGYCPLCSAEVTEFRDDLSLREFRISGLCQSCQDSVFAEVPTEPERFDH